jgi:hypothetical protein
MYAATYPNQRPPQKDTSTNNAKTCAQQKPSPLSEVEADFHPTPETEPTNFVFAAVVDYETASTSFILT